MKKVISAVFKVESEGYQALAELRNAPANDGFAVSEAFLVKQGKDGLKVLDSFDTGAESSDDMAIGSLLGALVGVMGGPIGMLLGGSYGMLLGSLVDDADILDNASIIERVSTQITEGEVAIIALADEAEEGFLAKKLSAFTDVNVISENAEDIAEEIMHAEKVEREMAKEARKKLFEEKKASAKETLEDRKAKIREKFQELNSTEIHFGKKPVDSSKEKSQPEELTGEETEKISGGAGDDLCPQFNKSGYLVCQYGKGSRSECPSCYYY